MFHNFLHMAQPKKAFSPSIFGKDATAGVRETRLSSFYIIPMVMIGVGVAGVYVCVHARMCVCVCVYSNKILYPTVPTAFYLLLFPESWDLGVLSTSKVRGVCWDNTLSKASPKRV